MSIASFFRSMCDCRPEKKNEINEEYKIGTKLRTMSIVNNQLAKMDGLYENKKLEQSFHTCVTELKESDKEIMEKATKSLEETIELLEKMYNQDNILIKELTNVGVKEETAKKFYITLKKIVISVILKKTDNQVKDEELIKEEETIYIKDIENILNDLANNKSNEVKTIIVPKLEAVGINNNDANEILNILHSMLQEIVSTAVDGKLGTYKGTLITYLNMHIKMYNAYIATKKTKEKIINFVTGSDFRGALSLALLSLFMTSLDGNRIII